MTSVAPASRGCPSGFEPPSDRTIINPTPFVRSANGLARLELAVFGAKCAGCIRKIESTMNALPGMQSARLNLSTGKLSLAWSDGEVSPLRIAECLDKIGYRSAPFDPESFEKDNDVEGKRLLRALAVAGFATANIMLLSVAVWAGGGEMGPATRELLHFLSAIIAIPAALYSGQTFFGSAFRALKGGHANMDVPISLGVILALSISIYEFFLGGEHTYFDAAVMLLFFLLIGRFLDHRLRLRARAAARDLLALQTVTASRVNSDGTLTPVSARDISAGDLISLAPGDRSPVDGVITDGCSSLDMSLVTGESAPVSAAVGAQIYAGVLNLSSRITMRASRTMEDSLVADLARLIEVGEQTKSRYVRLADRAAAIYVPVVHSLALATFLAWFFLLDAGLRVSAMNAIALLIITCPCALGLAAPAVQVVATGKLFRSGILVKTGDALERLAEVDTIIFDKTGTLTFGIPRLINRSQIGDEELAAAASLARASRHPLSRAIVLEAGSGKPAVGAVEYSGDGVIATIGGAAAKLGKAAFVGATSVADNALESWFRLSGRQPVRFQFADGQRPDAKETIKRLRDLGLKVEMLTGDRESVASKTAGDLEIDTWRAELSPKDKIDHLGSLGLSGRKVAMVGDGLNDAPSLACAHVSLSPGNAAGASQAAADFIYQGNGIGGVVDAVMMARAARRRVIENFAFAAIYNACALPLAATGLVTPIVAAIAMSGSSMFVTLNALRLGNGERLR